jgi:transposase
MMQTMTRGSEFSVVTAHLLVAFELGQRWWHVGFTTGLGQRPRRRRIAAGDLQTLGIELQRAKGRFGVPADAPVISCYEAGRDGFWLHRYLTAHAVTNYVIDSASIEVNRRARRSKTDQLDLGGLLNLLARYVAGDRRCWRVVRVPSVAAEDARQLHRTLETLQGDRTRLINRLTSVLATLGVRLRVTADFLRQVEAARLWDGTPIPAGARDRLRRDWQQLQGIAAQIKAGQAARTALRVEVDTPTGRYVAGLQTLRAIGPTGAWVLATEIFGWRDIRNGRQLGALVGLVPARYDSGTMRRDLGITRAGNAHVRRVMVQLAWGWLRYQPTSALSQWYQQRFGGGGPRVRRVGIVALARKLLVAVWRYIDAGVVPEGALLKNATV